MKRDSSSAYADDGTGVIRNDGADDGAMEEEAKKRREEREALRLGLLLTIPWVDLSFRVGDRIRQIDGRDILLNRKPGGENVFPKVQQITFDFERQQTQLEF